MTAYLAMDNRHTRSCPHTNPQQTEACVCLMCGATPLEIEPRAEEPGSGTYSAPTLYHIRAILDGKLFCNIMIGNSL